MKKLVYSMAMIPLLAVAGGELIDISTNYDEVLDVKPLVKVEVIEKKEKKREKKIKTLSKTLAKEKSSSYYIGLSLANMNVDGESSTVILKNGHPISAIAKVGYNLSEHIALEGRMGTGIKTDKVSFVTSKITTKLGGLYLKPHMEVFKKLNLFALAGYGVAEQELTNEKISVDGFSYGLGANYALSPTIDLTLDAVRYGKKGLNAVDAYAVGVDYKF